jgi:hypothetical protein
LMRLFPSRDLRILVICGWPKLVRTFMSLVHTPG